MVTSSKERLNMNIYVYRYGTKAKALTSLRWLRERRNEVYEIAISENRLLALGTNSQGWIYYCEFADVTVLEAFVAKNFKNLTVIRNLDLTGNLPPLDSFSRYGALYKAFSQARWSKYPVIDTLLRYEEEGLDEEEELELFRAIRDLGYLTSLQGKYGRRMAQIWERL
jgi:hypothetical protein